MMRTPPPDEGVRFGKVDIRAETGPETDWEAERRGKVNNRGSEQSAMRMEEVVKGRGRGGSSRTWSIERLAFVVNVRSTGGRKGEELHD
jgi:hypothetical protein